MSDEKNQDNSDYLGYSVYADTLWNRVEAALNKDQGVPDKLGDDPLVVGIFGEWGAGKSTLLKLVERRAAAAAKEGADAKSNILTVPVYFQPWKYEHEKHLLVPLVLHVVEATRQALYRAPTVRDQLVVLSKEADNAVATIGKTTQQGIQTARKWFPVLKKIVGSLSLFGVSIALPDEIDDWLKDAETVFASPDAKEQQRVATEKELRNKKLSFVDNGFHYYELHELLKSLTRPGKGEHVKDLAGAADAKQLRLNFVIFIDDLDRCLPEKSVETLELIKTVFNLESFAFVLALDEEVVERGIGHRYKDYALQNKKPEMPITGFEYLEKIIHLPFRLPGLTKDQARRFLERYESEEVAPKQPERWWFAQRHVVEEEWARQHEEAPMQASERNEAADANLSSMVLSAFTTYVPRKLVRLVELLHQVQEIALRRGKRLTVEGDSGADVRVITALVMIQLFQPDLYRLVRRKPQAFPLLLAAFARRGNGFQDFSDPDISDVDLWLWVVEESAGSGNDWIQTCSIAEAMNAVVRRIATIYHVVSDHGLPVQYQTRNEDGEDVTVTEFDTAKTRQKRSLSQNVKLPLVAQIVEHRAAQRHAFDPLRLAHALAGALETGQFAKDSSHVSPAASLQIDSYFSLLVPLLDPHWELYFGSAESFVAQGSWGNPNAFPEFAITGSYTTQVATSSSGRVVVMQPVRFPDRLLADLVSEQTEVQANLLVNNELEFGKCLETNATQRLLSQLREWRMANPRDKHRAILMRGIRVLAPLIPRELGAEFLKLVDAGSRPPYWVKGDPEAFASTDALRHAAERADISSLLMQDDRFDPERLHLPFERPSANQQKTELKEREPIPGFVRVFADNSQTFRPFLGPAVTLHAFYVARFLTTVDQYAHFVAGHGYGEADGDKPAWWDTLGWLWRTGRWEPQIGSKQSREHLARREPELRRAPMHWSEQLANGSRPVMGVNWFEARAYANWLTLQLKGELSRLPEGYAARLPTEAQWERAARVRDGATSDDRLYPWGYDDDNTVHLRSNIGPSQMGHPSPVGLFAPSPLGLCDLSGNLWEWQSNFYVSNGSGQNECLPSDVFELKTHEDLEQCDLPALRGGAWYNTPELVRASFRGRNQADYWGNDVGFRMVLSLAE